MKYGDDVDKHDGRVEVVVAKGQDWTPTPDRRGIAGVLLDVPCSATGTGARNPYVLRRSSDLGDLLSVQLSLAWHTPE